ncbi:MAG: LysM peptidoglycan-binding domain-containing protein [Acidobacteria bacterium]|nr:MAG: LysM peptidoglycan-binding domain-containing protein [Acidobacteriota bacterium]REK02074.1 MAG: LysM peptidoglycan-binding domain-containing protein [Acidobacteriota bacterium]REK15032.1 MAG: LysM peptidoglycan-binding domain-containing protein [Acidobacteriota bacterium]REK45746.1 MAG: LysM peptidoglycan-binding domain-containing protein [Acidobacteriota bacterium]
MSFYFNSLQKYLSGAISIGLLAAFLVSSSPVSAQVTGSTSSGRNASKPEAASKAEARIRQISNDAGKYFKQGLDNLSNSRRFQAREDFDRSVEIFLISGVNVQRDQGLRECYNELIETIYRMEFPNGQQPANLRRLSTVCNWEIKDEVADNITAMLKVPVETGAEDSLITAAVDGSESPAMEFGVGFADQSFEASPLDELSKLVLNEVEQDVDNPEARIEYEVIRNAAANKSLGFTFQMHRMVQQFLNYYRGRGRRTMEVGLYRSGYFMTMARRIFREEGVPENVAWLGQVESAWKPTAHSWASAAGLWQFIPGTGSRYGLRRTAYLDERQSFEQATRASARYLKFLANRYGGNWELAMAGYNCGEGNVDRAIRRAGVANFWAAYPYLPKETRNYVPNILATILIANNPHQYGFGHIKPAPRLRYDRLRVPASTSLNLIAQASDSTVQYLRFLNPELRTNRTPPEPYVVRVPAGKANEVVAIIRRGSLIKDDTTRLANSGKGETWESISRRTGVTVAALKEANPGMKSPRGKVFVPVVVGNNVASTSYNRPATKETVDTDPSVRIVKAKSGETVRKLAERVGASPVEVAKLNGLYVNSRLNAGREIRVPVKSSDPAK